MNKKDLFINIPGGFCQNKKVFSGGAIRRRSTIRRGC
jgi:hypothetical protein